MSINQRIMIIDDDILILKSLEKLLVTNGYSVSPVKSGELAISALKKGLNPDLILLDIAMPDMDGYSTFTKIKEINNFPIIFLTSMETTEDEIQGLQLGALDYITKPFVPDILLARINNQLKNIDSHKKSDTTDTAVSFDEDKIKALEEILTDTELKIAKLIALGYTNHEIADNYSYSYSYVKKLAYRIYNKLQINKRNELRPYLIKDTE